MDWKAEMGRAKAMRDEALLMERRAFLGKLEEAMGRNRVEMAMLNVFHLPMGSGSGGEFSCFVVEGGKAWPGSQEAYPIEEEFHGLLDGFSGNVLDNIAALGVTGVEVSRDRIWVFGRMLLGEGGFAVEESERIARAATGGGDGKAKRI